MCFENVFLKNSFSDICYLLRDLATIASLRVRGMDGISVTFEQPMVIIITVVLQQVESVLVLKYASQKNFIAIKVSMSGRRC